MYNWYHDVSALAVGACLVGEEPGMAKLLQTRAHIRERFFVFQSVGRGHSLGHRRSRARAIAQRPDAGGRAVEYTALPIAAVIHHQFVVHRIDRDVRAVRRLVGSGSLSATTRSLVGQTVGFCEVTHARLLSRLTERHCFGASGA